MIITHTQDPEEKNFLAIAKNRLLLDFCKSDQNDQNFRLLIKNR